MILVVELEDVEEYVVGFFELLWDCDCDTGGGDIRYVRKVLN